MHFYSSISYTEQPCLPVIIASFNQSDFMFQKKYEDGQIIPKIL